MNQRLLNQLQPEQVEVVIKQVQTEQEPGVEESELDEMWSYVGKKDNLRWLWHRIDQTTGRVLAYVFGQGKDEVFQKLKKLLEPFGIKRYCTDGWGFVGIDELATTLAAEIILLSLAPTILANFTRTTLRTSPHKHSKPLHHISIVQRPDLTLSLLTCKVRDTNI